jgi:hypothetical protein
LRHGRPWAGPHARYPRRQLIQGLKLSSRRHARLRHHGRALSAKSLRIKQPGKLFADRASYEIFDDDRQLVAVVGEVESHARVKLLRKEMLTSSDDYRVSSSARCRRWPGC